MNQHDHWLLPEGIMEALPDQAERIERYRRRLLDLYHSWGYELVIPPLIEYLESLLTGTGRDLDLKTFKLTDQLTGRTMGVRADMTPQVARMDAHLLKREEPTRLCYLGTVLHTRAVDFSTSRSPIQVGAELFGHAGMDSDLEVIKLMLETLKICYVPRLYIDLGHVGIYRGLARQARFDSDTEAVFFDTLQRKSMPEIQLFLHHAGIEKKIATMLLALATLNGNEDCLDRANTILADAPADVHEALHYIDALSQRLRSCYPEVEVHYDLAELRGFHYQTGVVFAAYIDGRGQEIARGGRYDGIGHVFGRDRAATGFSADLKVLLGVSVAVEEVDKYRVFAPAGDDVVLLRSISDLRAQGHVVVQGLAGQQANAVDMKCDKTLRMKDHDWQLMDV